MVGRISRAVTSSAAVVDLRLNVRRGSLAGALLFTVLAVSCADSADTFGSDEGPVDPRPAPPAPPVAVEDRDPAAQTSSADSALAALRAYYAAIDAGAYEDAYGLWASGGQASGQSFDEFRDGFARTESSEVSPGLPGRIEGAAGSRFIQIPAVVRAVLESGERQCFEGSYTLVRSVVDGATAEQRSWRIHSAVLNPCEEAGPDPP